MTEKTKLYRSILHEDFYRIKNRNNSKDAKRTPEQIAQSKAAKHDYYSEKWTKLLREAETEAQKKYCKAILEWNEIYNGTKSVSHLLHRL